MCLIEGSTYNIIERGKGNNYLVLSGRLFCFAQNDFPFFFAYGIVTNKLQSIAPIFFY